ncbi:MAG: hypothetical protein A2284_15850 [Deltaproteobacteria bacterium RIFOXYA12_FULL_61_11]|nr:MAG: hypothetical protein A2284_15850 [Deltaproteobacteria bacterium RIFOXYA12_FULL_61_11]
MNSEDRQITSDAKLLRPVLLFITGLFLLLAVCKSMAHADDNILRPGQDHQIAKVTVEFRLTSFGR